MEVGTALLEISDRRLYRETHSTFEEYCRDKWKVTARRAYQLCEAAEVVKALPENVNNCSHSLIQNEGQARELARVPVENRVAVLEAAGDNGKVTAATIRQAYADTEICRAAAAIRMEQFAARNAKVADELLMPAALNPLDAAGRITRVMVSPDKQQFRLIIGPNKAGTKLPGWWKDYQESPAHKDAEARAKALEQEAERLAKSLQAQARRIREDATERACQQFVALHGTPIHYVVTFDVAFPAGQLPKDADTAARYLLDRMNSGQLEPTETGCWGDMSLPFPMVPRPAKGGWAQMGSPGWLNEFFPNLATTTGGPPREHHR